MLFKNCLCMVKVKTPSKDEEESECWICMESQGPLTNVCECHERPVHTTCIARWQFINIHKFEETHCRFCKSKYNMNWKNYVDSSNFIKFRIRNMTPIVNVIFCLKTKTILLPSNPSQVYPVIRKSFSEEIKTLDFFDPVFTVSMLGLNETFIIKQSNINKKNMEDLILKAKISNYITMVRYK